MLLWFADLMNVTEEVTTHRPNVSTHRPRQKKRPLISDHIKGPLVAAF